jgi:hypothetical protein
LPHPSVVVAGWFARVPATVRVHAASPYNEALGSERLR